MLTKKLSAIALIVCFLANTLGYSAYGGTLPIPTGSFAPPLLKYLSINSVNPYNYFNFLLDTGENTMNAGRETLPLQKQTKQLINYFFLGLTLPQDSFWVNLNPAEPNRLTSDSLAKTDMGKALLEQDLLLKKQTSQYLNPRNRVGKQFWQALYNKLGTKNIKKKAITTSNRVWIVPDKAVLVETEDGVLISEAKLKVLTEQDYLTINNQISNNTHTGASRQGNPANIEQINKLANDLIREIIIPELTKDVNNSPKYAPLRQIYHSLILAQYYKQTADSRHQAAGRKPEENSPYSSIINKGNTAGLESQLPWSKDKLFQQYLSSYKKGEYRIKQKFFGLNRMYFSGGIVFGQGVSSAISITLRGSLANIEINSSPTLPEAPVLLTGSTSASPVGNIKVVRGESGMKEKASSGVETKLSAEIENIINEFKVGKFSIVPKATLSYQGVEKAVAEALSKIYNKKFELTISFNGHNYGFEYLMEKLKNALEENKESAVKEITKIIPFLVLLGSIRYRNPLESANYKRSEEAIYILKLLGERKVNLAVEGLKTIILYQDSSNNDVLLKKQAVMALSNLVRQNNQIAIEVSRSLIPAIQKKIQKSIMFRRAIIMALVQARREGALPISPEIKSILPELTDNRVISDYDGKFMFDGEVIKEMLSRLAKCIAVIQYYGATLERKFDGYVEENDHFTIRNLGNADIPDSMLINLVEISKALVKHNIFNRKLFNNNKIIAMVEGLKRKDSIEKKLLLCLTEEAKEKIKIKSLSGKNLKNENNGLFAADTKSKIFVNGPSGPLHLTKKQFIRIIWQTKSYSNNEIKKLRHDIPEFIHNGINVDWVTSYIQSYRALSLRLETMADELNRIDTSYFVFENSEKFINYFWQLLNPNESIDEVPMEHLTEFITQALTASSGILARKAQYSIRAISDKTTGGIDLNSIKTKIEEARFLSNEQRQASIGTLKTLYASSALYDMEFSALSCLYIEEIKRMVADGIIKEIVQEDRSQLITVASALQKQGYLNDTQSQEFLNILASDKPVTDMKFVYLDNPEHAIRP